MIDLTPELNMVRDFHAAFNHPIGAEPSALRDERRLTRTRWILSELNEFALAANLPVEIDAAVGMSDALTDALYLVLGSKVEMGEKYLGGYINVPLEGTAKQILWQLQRPLLRHLIETERSSQLARLDTLAELLVRYHQTLFDAPIQDIFPFVHEANMAKLWPDGKPRYRESDGKVLKPEGWIPPEARIRQYFLVRQSAIVNAV